MQHIILVGMPGCGKTSVAKKLSTMLCCTYVDLDQLIERELGKTIENIFSTLGEDFFRQKESELLKQIIENNQERIIIATGGGTFVNATNQEICLNSGIVFWINMSINLIAQRIKNSDVRPMFQNTNVFLKLQSLLFSREEFYKHAHYEIAINDFKPPKAVALIIHNIIASQGL